jgi:hypothetical protein
LPTFCRRFCDRLRCRIRLPQLWRRSSFSNPKGREIVGGKLQAGETADWRNELRRFADVSSDAFPTSLWFGPNFVCNGFPAKTVSTFGRRFCDRLRCQIRLPQNWRRSSSFKPQGSGNRRWQNMVAHNWVSAKLAKLPRGTYIVRGGCGLAVATTARRGRVPPCVCISLRHTHSPPTPHKLPNGTPAFNPARPSIVREKLELR